MMMRYWLNVYRCGFVYTALRFYTAWVDSGLSRTLRALQAVADFVVASDRYETVRRAFVAYTICENSMPESVRLRAELVGTFFFVHKYAAAGIAELMNQLSLAGPMFSRS